MNRILLFLFIASMTGVMGCNAGHVHHPGGHHGDIGYGHGYGWGAPVIVLPKPTLLPRLKKAFIDGKLSVDTYKIIAPSLKPLPYKKGVGWVKKHKHFPHHGLGHHGYGYPGIGHIGNPHGYGHGIGYPGIGYGIGHGHPLGHPNLPHHHLHTHHYPIGRSGQDESAKGGNEHSKGGRRQELNSGIIIVEKGLPRPHRPTPQPPLPPPNFNHKRNNPLSRNSLLASASFEKSSSSSSSSEEKPF